MSYQRRVDELIENRVLIEAIYEKWKENPSSISKEWQYFFEGFSLASCPRSCIAQDRARKQSNVASLIYAYRSLGHLAAHTNPLEDAPLEPDFLSPSNFGLDESDLENVFDTGHLGGPERAKLKEIISILKEIYCGKVGIEYIHIQNKEERRFLQNLIEPIKNKVNFSREDKLRILENLVDSELFETYIDKRYPGQKRFSLEGLETLIVAIHTIVEEAPSFNVEEIVMAMAHRGRLNVLANILDKPYEEIFFEFEDIISKESIAISQDVKYHKGFSSNHKNRFKKEVHITLTPNPSHLEAVDPVALGVARAKQRLRNDTEEREKVLPILIHGDAAFSGQGVVAECFNLSKLVGYTVGGTIHIIANNQIGFTTAPEEGRSTRYATDVAKIVEAPIFHINAEEPELVAFYSTIALKYRQKFKKDVVLDIIGYRKYGHSEADEPSFTQPKMYKIIRNKKSIRRIYVDKLVKEKVLTEEEASFRAKNFEERLENALKKIKNQHLPKFEKDNKGRWKDYLNPYSFDEVDTTVDKETLLKIVTAVTTPPLNFSLHPKLLRRLEEIKRLYKDGKVDWAMAESFAFGSILLEGKGVRLSGEDSQRGTFSHRHSVYRDINTEETYIPLNNLSKNQGKFCVYNSMLSEFSVLGFDFGYSLVDPNMLVIWEAQFGDFSNGAQVIIDQFITSSLKKWGYSSGIILLLPHGVEGQGPEHSHAYLERYLQLASEENIEVVNLTKASQYFHLLRRQIKRNFRRPLFVMAPKSTLRHPLMASSLSELENGKFEEIIDESNERIKPKSLIFLSGKIFFDLFERRERERIDDVAIIRIEQIYPFNERKFLEIAQKYKSVKKIVWVQEETKNRGAYNFLKDKISSFFNKELIYIGRDESATPSSGSFRLFREEQERIIENALNLRG